MWEGGNQWSGYAAWLSFFRHVVHLPIDYTKWAHYEVAAVHGGPRIMHAEFCMISDRPRRLLVDAQSRPHCEDGPFCEWSDGTALYAVHGVRTPAWIVEHPERITSAAILAETNAEIRRVMLARMGYSAFLLQAGAKPVHEDGFGRLYQVPAKDGEPITVVRVVNSTPEPDGSSKEYLLAVHPELRPLLDGDTLGEPQRLTALNAIASTFGLRGDEYAPQQQT